MPKITNLHAEVDGKPILKGLSLAPHESAAAELVGMAGARLVFQASHRLEP